MMEMIDTYDETDVVRRIADGVQSALPANGVESWPARRPAHVAVIVDGNRRWARARHPRSITAGHREGARNVERLVGWCRDLGVKHLTIYLLSLNNLSRDSRELTPLLTIIERLAQRLSSLHRYCRLRIIGAPHLLPRHTHQVLQTAVNRSLDHQGVLTVNMAIGYGGRQEIADAVSGWLRAQTAVGASLDDLVDTLDVERITQHLYTSGQPDPDLVIRSGGERRLSGFLLWQSSEAELFFSDKLWPAFDRTEFLRAIDWYAGRQRRFGA